MRLSLVELPCSFLKVKLVYNYMLIETLIEFFKFRDKYGQSFRGLLNAVAKKHTEPYFEDYDKDFEYRRIVNFIVDFNRKIINQTIEEMIKSEIKYWKKVFDDRPKGRDLESDNIAQNFARIEIDRLEKLLIDLRQN